MNDILNYLSENQVDLVYFAIGSVFRCNDLNKLTPVLDQVYPNFLREWEGSFKAIHFDPRFGDDETKLFTEKYFTSLGFFKEKNSWFSKNKLKEFIIVEEEIYHDCTFFTNLSQVCMPRKLIVQDFTGKLLDELFIQVYYSFSPHERIIFRKNVIFDMTCGNASCMTDMSVTYPMLDSNGDFLNFMLICPEDFEKNINKDPKLNALIKEYYVKQYKRILNEEHTNYRRRIQGNTCLFYNVDYDNNSDPNIIFNVLVKNLNKIIFILKKLGFQEEKYNELIKNYYDYDMYKWYSLMNSLV
jgi:hypothetical protein